MACGIMAQQEKWTPAERKLLGTKPDDVLARELGRSHFAVSAQRRQARIPRYLDNDQVRRWTRLEDRLLGSYPDKDAALRLGRTVAAVAERRRLLRIPPMRR